LNVPVCPVDFIIVKLEKKFQDEIVTPGGLRLFLATEFQPGEHATITGTVISVPKAMSDHAEMKNIEPDVLPGDELVFSYLVVNSMDQHFTYPVYEYEFEYKGESYWRVPYSLVLGYFRDGELYPASGYVFLDQRDPEKYADKTASGLWVPDTAREKKDPAVWSTVRRIGKSCRDQLPLDVQPGDEVLFERKYIERYTIKGKKWWVSKQERILGKRVIDDLAEVTI
jgi:co-chaperonin GroES (HSP10)